MTFREALARHLQAIQARDLAALAATVARLDYREPPQTRSESLLTLVFQRRDGEWRMVQDQNTPIKR